MSLVRFALVLVLTAASAFALTVTGNTTNGSPIVTGINTTGIAVGMPVSGPGIQPGSVVISIVPGNPGSITLSLLATATANGVSLTFSASANIPTLGTWGMLLFGGALLLYGLKVMRPGSTLST